MTDGDARLAAEVAARVTYGRLLARLVSWSRDIAGAEDALAEAFLAALATWPDRGIPHDPDAWLLTAARNGLRKTHRHQAVREAAQADIERRYETLASLAAESFPDERLKLLFVCAHPAIAPAMRAPLMLQTVLGLNAVRIGSAFLISPATMGQRLVRTKAKIRGARLRFEVPSGDNLADRLDDVLNAVYAAFGTGWDNVPGAKAGPNDLVEEAIFLGRLLVSLMPDQPEAQGLLALMLYCEARRGTRRDSAGRFVPLTDQDASLWSRDMIIEAEGLLTSASRYGKLGRFQCEAAIQSVHSQRPIVGSTNHAALKTLYDLLASHSPSVGALVGRAAAYLDAGEPDSALRLLEEAAGVATERYQPHWVTRAHILAVLGRFDDALEALQTAVGLTEDASVRDYLIAVGSRWKAGGVAAT